MSGTRPVIRSISFWCSSRSLSRAAPLRFADWHRKSSLSKIRWVPLAPARRLSPAPRSGRAPGARDQAPVTQILTDAGSPHQPCLYPSPPKSGQRSDAKQGPLGPQRKLEGFERVDRHHLRHDPFGFLPSHYPRQSRAVSLEPVFFNRRVGSAVNFVEVLICQVDRNITPPRSLGTLCCCGCRCRRCCNGRRLQQPLRCRSGGGGGANDGAGRGGGTSGRSSDLAAMGMASTLAARTRVAGGGVDGDDMSTAASSHVGTVNGYEDDTSSS